MNLVGFDGGHWQTRSTGLPLPKDRLPHPLPRAYLIDPFASDPERDPNHAMLANVCRDLYTFQWLEQFCVWVDGPGCIYEPSGNDL